MLFGRAIWVARKLLGMRRHTAQGLGFGVSNGFGSQVSCPGSGLVFGQSHQHLGGLRNFKHRAIACLELVHPLVGHALVYSQRLGRVFELFNQRIRALLVDPAHLLLFGVKYQFFFFRGDFF